LIVGFGFHFFLKKIRYNTALKVVSAKTVAATLSKDMEEPLKARTG